MSAARLFGNMKVTAKAANAGICSRCSNGFTEGLCSAVVVDVLKSQTYAIMLVVAVSPSLIATSKIPAFGHGLLLDNAMRCDAKRWLKTTKTRRERGHISMLKGLRGVARSYLTRHAVCRAIPETR